MKKRIGIKDVAKEAGVSIATVSYIINKNPKESISQETIDRVNEAIKKLNYVPNLSARSLASNKTNLIGVVIPQTEPGKKFMFNNPFYGEFLSSVEYVARTKGYHVLISGTDANQSYLEVAKKRSLDGIIIVGMYDEDFYEDLKKSQIPIVLVDSYCKDHYFHSIQINDRYGGYIATKYLIEKGHRKIAYITGMLKKGGVNDHRLLGYIDALKEANIPFQDECVYSGNVGYEYGIEVADLIYKRGNRETAIFCSADIMAMGVMKGLKNRGLRIPQDISIMGFDDSYISKLLDPALTTVKQDINLKGCTAANIIIDIAENRIKGKQDVILPLEIVERESVESLI
ncbi:MAG: HTH lacI-type domain-containing protein [Xylanivirga thermophila]|uniref:LacI family DNA-binding transcriptional regulator n=1 Tax=Xylanivirga thermophila TaxID=2496273 RepID=UPI0039F5D414